MTPAPVQAWPQPAGHIPLTGLSSAPAAGHSRPPGRMCSLGFPCGSLRHWVSLPSCGLGAGSRDSALLLGEDAEGVWGHRHDLASGGCWSVGGRLGQAASGSHLPRFTPCQPAKGERASEWDRAEARACREEQAGECVGPRLLLSLSVF